MAAKWRKSNYPGVRYREHLTRKHGVQRDKYFIISYRMGKKRKDESVGWASKGWTAKKASKLLSDIQENIRTGQRPVSLKEMREIAAERKKAEQLKAGREITFGKFFLKTYVPAVSGQKKEYTMQNEIGFFKNWLNPEIGHLPFDKIKPFNLEKIKKNMLSAGRAPRTLQHCLSIFRQAWNFARLNDLVNENSPTLKVKLPKIENKRVRFYSHEEAEILLKTLQKKSQQLYDMTLFSLHTGVRAGEIFALTWGALDLKNGTAYIRDSKGAPRHVYLTDDLQKMFKRLKNDQEPSELIFKSSNGKQITSISKTFFRAVQELGFNHGVSDRRDKATFHTCRHTFASWHVQNGTDLYTVKELLGHSTIQLTERYSHLRPDGLKKATKDFEQKFKRAG